MNAFLGVKGSPVQIRPSRRRSKADSGLPTRPFGFDGSARALPFVAPTKRSGVSCRIARVTSGYSRSARSRAGWRYFPPSRVNFPRVKGSPVQGPGRQGWFWSFSTPGYHRWIGRPRSPCAYRGPLSVTSQRDTVIPCSSPLLSPVSVLCRRAASSGASMRRRAGRGCGELPVRLGALAVWLGDRSQRLWPRAWPGDNLRV